jgi:UDP-2,4-diacetamido-2,4,6-trideoxy-beta-L-altropyranose hydrolase
LASNAPWIEDVNNCIANLSYKANLLVNVNNMSQLMEKSDVIIGAAGTTSWERCCMGIPTVGLCLAKNQENIYTALTEHEIIFPVKLENLKHEIITALISFHDNPIEAFNMGHRGANLVDGKGVSRVVKQLLGFS